MSGRLKIFACVAAVGIAVSAQAAAPVTGKWVTQSKDGVVEIYECGATICGKLAKFLVPPPNGVGQKDVNNPDKELRSRTLLGMNILTGFKAAGNEWKGQIYDPKSGNLVVKGCIGPFCQAQSWTPAR